MIFLHFVQISKWPVVLGDDFEYRDCLIAYSIFIRYLQDRVFLVTFLNFLSMCVLDCIYLLYIWLKWLRKNGCDSTELLENMKRPDSPDSFQNISRFIDSVC